MWVDILGFVGTGLLGVTLVPQVIKTYQLKSASELSYVYLTLQTVSNIIFIVYGYFINRLPILLCNGFVLLCSVSLLVAKMKYSHNDNYERLRNSSV
jgi:MtN3 and saliva related transmembrane protein